MSDEQSECVHCGATDDRENGILVGLVGELNENVCNICRAEALQEVTVLKRRESEVAALKEQGMSHSDIADMLEISKSTVDEYSRRLRDRVRRATVTANKLQRFA